MELKNDIKVDLIRDYIQFTIPNLKDTDFLIDYISETSVDNHISVKINYFDSNEKQNTLIDISFLDLLSFLYSKHQYSLTLFNQIGKLI